MLKKIREGLKIVIGGIGATIISSKTNAKSVSKYPLKCPTHKETKKAVKKLTELEK